MAIAGDRGVTETLARYRQHQRDVTPTDLHHVENGGHVAAVVVGALGFAAVAERLRAGECESLCLRNAFEEGCEGVQLDRILVFTEVPLARDRPQHLRSALMRLLDDRFELARQFQIYCHGSTFRVMAGSDDSAR
jgi:hypothetical protein